MSPAVLRSRAAESVRQGGHRVVIFSDGSVGDGNESGGSAAVVLACPNRGEVSAYGRCVGVRVRGFLSSLEVEIRALHLALDTARLVEDGPPVLICSDSKSALEGLIAPGAPGEVDLTSPCLDHGWRTSVEKCTCSGFQATVGSSEMSWLIDSLRQLLRMVSGGSLTWR